MVLKTGSLLFSTQYQSIPHTGGERWFYKSFRYPGSINITYRRRKMVYKFFRRAFRYSSNLGDTTLNYLVFCANFDSMRDGAVAGGE